MFQGHRSIPGGSGGEAGEEHQEHTTVYPYEVAPFLNLALLDSNTLERDGLVWNLFHVLCRSRVHSLTSTSYLFELGKGVLGQGDRKDDTHKPFM